MKYVPRLGFGATAIAVGTLFLLGSPGGAAAAHRATRVRAVSNPPASVPARLRLKVGGSATKVSVYASPTRKLVSGAQRLGRAKIRHHRLALKVPSALKPGAWFIVVCPGRGRRHCAASKKPMLKLPAKLSAPVQANPVLETDHATTATIGSAGGTLTATAANGTRFNLAIAAGSVPAGTQITMTPLASLGGPSWVGKLIGAVQLAPEGLVLVHGGTLTITPTTPVPVRRQVAVGYDGTGSDLREVPLAPTTSQIQIPLAHFSGAGAGDSSGGIPSSTGSTILDFYAQLIAEDMQAARDGQMSEQDAFDQARSWDQDAYSDVMRDEVPPGLNDDDAATQAVRDLITVAKWSELLGEAPDSMFNAEKPTIFKLLEGIYNRAQQKCAQHDLSQISKIISADRNEQLIMGTESHQVSEDLKCLRFRIDFDSAIDVIAGSGGSGSWHYEYVAHPTVTPDQQSGYQFLTGSTFGSYAAASGTITGDDGTTGTVTSATHDAFDVVKFSLDVSDSNAPVTLILDVHSPSEQYHVHDPSGPYDYDYTDHIWLNTFGEFHPPQAGWVSLTLDRVPGNGDLVARASFSNSAPDGSATEATTVDVFHTPGG